MTKSDAPLSEIGTSNARKPQRNSDLFHRDAPIHAWDTETRDGDVFMLSCSPDDAGAFVRTADDYGGTYPDTIPSARLLENLCRKRFRAGVNVWYNLGFDAQVLFKGLGSDVVRDLRHTTQATFEEGGTKYALTYIPGKFLKIEKGRDTWEHYDIAQILPGGLATNAAEWLDRDKMGDTVDVDRFGDVAYLIDNRAEIERYARIDADLTRDLWHKFVSVAESSLLKIPCGKPYSTGYLAYAYLNHHIPKPGWGLDAAQSLAWDAFRGGRFEVLERGVVGDVAVPDINSAYPAVLSELPDPATVAWTLEGQESPVTMGALRRADWGFVDVTVSTWDGRIQPFAVKPDGAVVYPRLSDARVTVLVDTFLWAVQEGLVTDYTLHRAALARETDATRYPFGFLKELYDRRNRWKRQGRDHGQRLLKIVYNSMYGKTAQTNLRGRWVDGPTDANDLKPHQSFKVPSDSGGRALIVSQESGSIFNPFLAAHITGRTRLELLKRVFEYGLQDDVVMFATDSLMVRAEAFEASDFHRDLVDGSTLGAWDYDARGDAVVVGSGVYEVWRSDVDETAFHTGGRQTLSDVRELTAAGVKTGTRGFREADLDGSLWTNLEATGGDAFEITNYRPVSMGEAMSQTKLSLSDVGAFRETGRPLRAGFDSGRVWERDEPTFADLFARSEASEPLHVADVDLRKSA